MRVNQRSPSAIGEIQMSLVRVMINYLLLLWEVLESASDLLRKCIMYGQDQPGLTASISLELI